MNDTTLMRSVAEAAPVTDQELEGLDLDDALGLVLAQILGEAEPQVAPDRVAPRRRLPRLRLAMAGAAALVAAGAAFITLTPGDEGGPTAYAAEAVRVAEVNPRILIGESGWHVTQVYEFEENEGAIVFSKDGEQVELEWLPAADYDRYERQESNASTEYSEVLGQRALTSGENGQFRTLVPPTGDVFVMLYPLNFPRGDEYWQGILSSLETVDVDTWLSAMPSEVVLPNEAFATLDEMLRGIPVPPGFRSDQFEERELSGGREHVAAVITQAVSCGWVDAWVAATQTGDQAAAEDAVRALEGYQDWPIREYWSDSLIPATAKFMRTEPKPDEVVNYTEQQLNCIEYP
jgi:hypothetical protein